MKKIMSILRNNRGFLIFLVLLFAMRGSLLDWHPVPTGSMKPTILEGDVIVANKVAYDIQIPFSSISLKRVGEPKRGEIIVFTSEKSGKRLIKRLVGLPGETLEVVNNQLVINGKFAQYIRLPESDPRIPATAPDREPGFYALESTDDMAPHIIHMQPGKYNPNLNFGPITIPEDEYFFMGDNRDDSADSRYYGPAPRSELRGRAFTIMLSSRIKENYVPRWDRFFKTLYAE